MRLTAQAVRAVRPDRGPGRLSNQAERGALAQGQAAEAAEAERQAPTVMARTAARAAAAVEAEAEALQIMVRLDRLEPDLAVQAETVEADRVAAHPTAGTQRPIRAAAAADAICLAAVLAEPARKTP